MCFCCKRKEAVSVSIQIPQPPLTESSFISGHEFGARRVARLPSDPSMHSVTQRSLSPTISQDSSSQSSCSSSEDERNTPSAPLRAVEIVDILILREIRIRKWLQKRGYLV